MRQTIEKLVPVLLVTMLMLAAADTSATEAGCSASAHLQRLACEFDLRDDFFTASAHCLDEANADPQPGGVIRQEVAYGEAEDMIVEIDLESGDRVELAEFTNDL